MDFRFHKGGRWRDTLSGLVMGWNMREGEGCGNSGGSRTESLEVGCKEDDVQTGRQLGLPQGWVERSLKP